MQNSPYPLLLFLLIILATALFLANSDPISAATSQAEANALLANIPAGGWIADKLLSSLFSIVLSGVVLSIAGFALSLIRKWWRERQYQKPAWKSGLSAYWHQKFPKQPKPMTAEQMMQMALLQRLPPTQKLPSPQIRMVTTQPQADDDLDLRF